MASLTLRLLALLFTSAAVLGSLDAQNAPAPALEFPAPSPACTLKQRVGLTDIEVDYSRPGVKGRKIFGGLETWGEVWRAGANSATKVIFSTPVKFGGVAVPAGTYGLFAQIGPDEWTVILNKIPNQWGAYQYNAKDDIARVAVKPVALSDLVETYTIDINDIRDESATLNLIWEKTRVPVKIEVDTVATLVPKVEAVMASNDPKKPYASAAMFYLDHDLDLKKADGWMDQAIAAQPDAYYLIYRKAKIQAKMGDKPGAIATARKSIELANKAGGSAKDEYLRLNEALISSLQ